MERKKLIRLALFIIVAIIALVIVENSIRGIGNFVTERKAQKAAEKSREEYEASPQYAEEKMLEGVVADFAELLKNKDIDSLYNLIDENYRDYRYQNKKELFEEYIEKYLNDNTELTLQSYEKINGRYYCRILASTPEEIFSFVTLINTNEDNTSYTLIFDNISSIENLSKIYKNSLNIECNILYKVTAEKTCIYTVEFTNLNDVDVNYTINKVSMINTKGSGFSASVKDNNMSLKAGEKVRKDIVFNASGIHSFPATRIVIELKDTNGDVKNMDIYLDSSM